MTKKRKQSIEETIKFLEEKKNYYNQKIAGYNRLLQTVELNSERYKEVVKERTDWCQLHNEVESALLFIKTQLIFEEN